MFGVCRFIVFVWGVSLGCLCCVGRGWVDFGARVLALGGCRGGFGVVVVGLGGLSFRIWQICSGCGYRLGIGLGLMEYGGLDWFWVWMVLCLVLGSWCSGLFG